MSKSKSVKATWRYTILAGGKGGKTDDLSVVLQIGDLGTAKGYVTVGACVSDAGLPPLPGGGLWLWLDIGTTVTTGGEYHDEIEPTWKGAWVGLDTRHFASLATGGVIFDEPMPWVERERNDAIARIDTLEIDLWVAQHEVSVNRQFIDDLLPLLAEVMPGRERDVGVPQAVAEAIAEVRRLRAEVERMRYRLDVDEQDVDEADIGDMTEHDDSPQILAWMAANGFEYRDIHARASGDPAGIWRDDVLVWDGSPVPDERVINALALHVGRPPLDVLDEIKAMPVDDHAKV